MSLNVRPATETEVEKWNRYVERSDQGTIFHRYEWLRTAENHSSATLHTYVGVKGESIRGLFPFYTMQKGPFSLVLSPLPKTGVPFLGPILLLDPNVKQRKRDKANKRFIDGWLDTIQEEFSPSYISITAPPRYQDIRPFKWEDFSNSTSFTYRIDLSGGQESVIKRFSGDARSSIKNSDEERYTLEMGTEETINLVYEHITRRYEEQSRSYPLTREYLRDVYLNLPDDCINTYEGSVGGRPVSGRLSLFGYGSAYLWQGSPKPDADIEVPINDLLNWRTMQDAIEQGFERCDHVGANTYRICKYKSKFNPNLTGYQQLTKGTLPANIALDLYKKFLSD